MRLISLNVAGGSLKEPLFNFIKKQSLVADIFVFQEVCDTNDKSAPKIFESAQTDLLKQLKNSLPDFNCHFEINRENFILSRPTSFNAQEGCAAFVKNTITVVGSRQLELNAGDPHKPMSESGKCNYRAIMQVLDLSVGDTPLTIAHLQGVAYPGHKLDSPERDKQAEVVSSLVKQQSGPFILCGDFNLMPQAKCFSAIRGDLRDLIFEYDIFTTRNRIIWEKYPGDPQFMADYAFVSPEIHVDNFHVPYVEISDHLPLILDFELRDTNLQMGRESGEYANANESKIIYGDLSFKVNGILFKVHNELGRYCNEKQYADAVETYLQQENIHYQREFVLPPSFTGEQLGRNKVDFLVEDKLVIELKAKKFITSEDYHQARRYLQAINKKLALLVNFRDERLKPKRIINSSGNL